MEPENLRRSWGRIRTTAGLAAVDVAVKWPGRINPPGPARGARPPNPQRDMAMLASYLGEVRPCRLVKALPPLTALSATRQRG
jgi:hypothetical protein